ncbi:MFS transporter [Actinocatenispora rupis]|uniref:MFS transporter n=1 Tax=Actinocatenispora rupis TaxID=519421 RepID=A0A8J3J5M8_9ACTN|nr:MFS transporter [Actinocatenispora rupis]GID16346.1 MFS transporter [Actinocatenispora rupis]
MTTLATTRGTAARQAAPLLGTTGLVTLLLGAGLPMIDFFVVNVALPTIDRTLHASTATLELVVAGYGIAYAVLMVFGGRLGDAYGRRRLFRVGLALFTLTSLACGLAPTAGALVAARVAQGAASAFMLPQVLATIQATTSGQRRSRALGGYGAMGGIATLVGQLLGGVLVAANIAGTQWRPIFLVNVPIGLVGLVLSARAVPETRSANPARTDLAGTVLLAATLLALLVPLTEGRTLGWPAWSWVLLALAPVAGGAFLAVERRIEARGRVPLLPPSLLRTPSMRRGLLIAVPFFAGFAGFMFAFALAAQDGLRLGPSAAGLTLAPLALPFLVTSMVSARVVSRLGRRTVPVGAALQALGVLGIAVGVLVAWPGHAVVAMVPGMVVTGVGQALAMTTLFRVVLAGVPADRAGAGAGVLSTTQQSALALGAALLGGLFVGLVGPLGTGTALVVVLLVQCVTLVGIAVAARRLPDPRG